MCKNQKLLDLINNDPVVAYNIIVKGETEHKFVQKKISEQWLEINEPWTATRNIEFLKKAIFSLALNKDKIK